MVLFFYDKSQLLFNGMINFYVWSVKKQQDNEFTLLMTLVSGTLIC